MGYLGYIWTNCKLCCEIFWAIIAFLPLWYLIICYNFWMSLTKFLFTIVSSFLSHAIWFWSLKFSTRNLLFSNDTILDWSLVRLVSYINMCHCKVLIFLNWGVGLKMLLVTSHLCTILFICPFILVVACYLCVSTTISMMELTTSIPPFINLNSLLNIEEDNEFASQTQINNGPQEASNPK